MKNLKLASDKNLINGDDTSIYDEIVYKYKYILEYFINNVIDFRKYEEEISNSNLYIGKNVKYRRLNNYLDLDYIFLVNNLFVEKLSLEDIDLLKNTFDKDNITDDLLNLVKRTYKDVIYDNYVNGEYQNSIYQICYDMVTPFTFVDNDSLVFKIYYGKNLTNLDGDEYINLHEKQLHFFNKLISKLKNEVYDKLDIKCDILLEKDIY